MLTKPHVSRLFLPLVELFSNHSFSNGRPCSLSSFLTWKTQTRFTVKQYTKRVASWYSNSKQAADPNNRSISLSKKKCYVMFVFVCDFSGAFVCVTSQSYSKTSPDWQDIGLVAHAFFTSTGWLRWVDLAIDVMLCMGWISMIHYDSMIFGQSGSTFTHQRSRSLSSFCKFVVSTSLLLRAFQHPYPVTHSNLLGRLCNFGKFLWAPSRMSAKCMFQNLKLNVLVVEAWDNDDFDEISE